MLTLHEIKDPEELRALRPEWDRLADTAAPDDPYVRFEYLSPWCRFAARGKRLWVLVVRKQGELVGLAPLMWQTKRKLGMRVRKLTFVEKGTIPACDIILSQDCGGAIEAIFDRICAEKGWDVIELRPVRGDSLTMGVLEELARKKGLVWSQRRERRGLYVSIGGDWTGYLKRLGRGDRKDLRRLHKRLEELGSVEVVQHTGDAELEPAMLDVDSVTMQSWKGKNGLEPGFMDFLHEFGRLLSEKGWLNISFLKVNGRPIAYLYGIRYRNRLFLYYCAYHEHYASYGPGSQLLAAVLRGAFEEGLSTVDFGTDWDYLEKWADGSSDLREILISRKGVRSTLYRQWHLRMRPVVDGPDRGRFRRADTCGIEA